MNYLAHYFFDRKDNNAYYNFGLVLPDLMSIFSKAWKIKHNNLAEVQSGNNIQILSGILQHYERDHIFHSSDFFFEHVHSIKRYLEKLSLPYVIPKKHFVAHILLELVLDQVIVQMNPDIQEDFFHDIEQIQDSDIISFFSIKSFSNLDRFIEFFGKFREEKSFQKMKESKYIIRVLNRVLNRVNIDNRFASEENEFLLELIPEIRSLLQGSLNGLKKEFSDALV
jgi:hypothetical protein